MENKNVFNSVLEELLEGNKRFVSGNNIYPRQDDYSRKCLTAMQNPKAVIVGCSDSRVPPEIIFDQGLGDLFVIRTAGNVVGDISIESIEFGVDELKIGLIVILAHSNCGAINMAINGYNKNVKEFRTILDQIKPSISYKANETDIENVTKENARQVVKKLSNHSSSIRKYIENNNLKIVSAYYNIETGMVEII